MKTLTIKFQACCIHTHDCEKLLDSLKLLKGLEEFVIDFRENAIDNSFFQILKKNLNTEKLHKFQVFCDYNNIST